METNHENINNHCNNRTTAHISHKHVHSTLQTTLIQMMLFVWVTPQRCGRKVDRTLCLCIYGKECRIDRTLYSTLLNSTHFFSVVDRTPTHYFWSTGWELIRDACSRYSMRCGLGVFVEGRVTHSDVYKSVTKQRAAIQHSDSTSSSCPATRLVLHPASTPTQ